MIEKRFIIDGNFIQDRVTGKFYPNRDEFFVDAFNIIYNELKKEDEEL